MAALRARSSSRRRNWRSRSLPASWPASVACEYGGSRPGSRYLCDRNAPYLLRFVVLVVDVDVPDRVLVGPARGDRLHRGVGGQHRMVLVVVAVHAVAAD